MKKKEEVLVIVPAYNEEESVERVMKGLKEHLSHADNLVVNDGSSDLTSEKAKAAGALVLDLPFNLGIGGAMQTGYNYPFELLS